jgi:hypothetical protein
MVQAASVCCPGEQLNFWQWVNVVGRASSRAESLAIQLPLRLARSLAPPISVKLNYYRASPLLDLTGQPVYYIADYADV